MPIVDQDYRSGVIVDMEGGIVTPPHWQYRRPDASNTCVHPTRPLPGNEAEAEHEEGVGASFAQALFWCGFVVGLLCGLAGATAGFLS